MEPGIENGDSPASCHGVTRELGGAVVRGAESGHRTREPERQPRFKAGGAKFSYHGMDYQFQLLMLFAIRALNLGYSHFSLATELCDAGKVDDVVFSYGKVKKSTKRHFRFLQAKHATDQERKKITAAQLLDEGDGNMSLKKYFNSFRCISRDQNLLGEDGRVEDLIICTNVGFNYSSEYGGFKLKEDIFELVQTEGGEEPEDDILRAVLIKFKEKFDGRDKIVQFLKNNVVEIPREFALSLMKRKRYIHKKCKGMDSYLYLVYERALVEEVIDPSCGTFRSGFIDRENLSPAAAHFHDVLAGMYMKSDIDVKCKDDDMLRSFLAREKVVSDWESIRPEDCILKPEKLGKKLAEHVYKNQSQKIIKVCDYDSLLARNARALSMLAWERDGNGFCFREEFLTGTQVPENAAEFREHLINQLRYFNMNIESLRGYRIEIAFPTLTPCSKIECSETENVSLDEEVDSFLKKFLFAVQYPGLPSLEELIMIEITKIFNPAHKTNVFSRFQMMLQRWLMEKEVRILRKNDLETFFNDLKIEMEGCLMFEFEAPVTSFSGRKKELLNLRTMLNGEGGEGRDWKKVHVISIVGPGGIGKSELAKKYAQDHRTHYKSVVWIDAGCRELLEESFLRLAFDAMGISRVDKLGRVKYLKSVVEEVYDYFIGRSCLFVFDDAQPDCDLEEFLPKSARASLISVIATARYGNIGVVSEELVLGGFEAEESSEFFSRTIGSTSILDADEVEMLARVVNHFPLAMQQAAYCIHRMSLSLPRYRISDYLNSLERKSIEAAGYIFEEELEHVFLQSKYKAILTTRDILENMDHGPDIIELLSVMAYLTPGNVGIKSVLIFSGQAAIDSLKDCNFISTRDSKINVDRSVALITRSILRKRNQEKSIIRKVIQLGDSIKVSHLHTIWRSAVRYGELVKDFSLIPMKLMDALTYWAQDQRSILFGRKALLESVEILTSHVERDHYSILSILFKIVGGGGQYILDEKYALKSTKVLGSEHLNLNNDIEIKSLITHGLVLTLMREYRKAIEMFESVLENIHSTEDASVLIILKIANFYINLLRKNLNRRQKFSEPSCKLEWSSNVILERNDTMVREIEDHKSIIGRLKEVLLSHYAEAESLKNMGRYHDALQLMEQNYALCRRYLREESIISYWVRKDSAVLHLYMNNADKAVNILDEVRNNLLKLLDASNVYLLTVTRLTAYALSQMGKHSKALKYYEESYDHCRIALGESHKITLNFNAYVCVELLFLGWIDKAISFLKESSVLQEQEYLRTLIVQCRRLANLGKTAAALEMLTFLQGMYEEARGEENLDTLKITLEKGFASLKEGSDVSHQRGLSCLVIVREKLEDHYRSDAIDVRVMKRRIADFMSKRPES